MELTIHQLIQRLALALEKSEPEQREQFKKAWLDSLANFNQRTEEIRFENWKRS